MRLASSLIVLAFLLSGLAGCSPSAPLYRAGYETPKDPPPPPRRRPQVPPSFYALPKAGVASGGSVGSGENNSSQATATRVETAPLAPLSRNAQTLSRPSYHEIAAGETLFAVSRRFQIPIRALIDANGLRPPYHLQVGQRLRIPSPKLHRVARGETVYGISRQYGVEMSELVRINDIQPPFTIAVGSDLILPAAEAAQRVTQEAPEAERNNVALAPRPQAAQPPSASEPKQPQSNQASQSSAFRLGEPPRRKPTPPANARPTATTQQAALTPAPDSGTKARVPQIPSRTGGKFLWPVQGRVVSPFGPLGSGRHNDGINILAPRGIPVRAAENGIVVYVGSQLKGFGNLLLVKHADGWLTAYAHTETILVSKGDLVKRGQPLARVGSSGNVASPQLHFEVRKGKRAIDPMRILGPKPA